MAQAKTNMPKDIKKKCHGVIHTATGAATAGGLLPIPLADTIPISTAQVAMIISLGKIFDLTISDSVAKAIIGVSLSQTVGRTVVSSILKAIPGLGPSVGSFFGGATAGAVTEALGWLVADDFYRISIGKSPEDIVGAVSDLNNFRSSKL